MSNTVVTQTLANVADYGQLASSQSARTSWTPGKANPIAGESNWGVETPIKVGIPALDAIGIEHVRVVDVSRNLVNNPLKPTPVVTSTVVETVSEPSIVGTHVLVTTQLVDPSAEHSVGGDEIKA